MDLAWLDDFLTLAEQLNFNRAAEARNLTQPAFSRRIKGLEEWVGAPLFDRGTHRVALTRAGEVFLPEVTELTRRLAAAREAAVEAAGLATSTLCLAATHALSHTFLPGWLGAVEARNGLATGISLLSDTVRACERAMIAGRARFLLRHAHPSVPERLDTRNFRWISVGTDTLVSVCAPNPDGTTPRHPLPGTADKPLPLLAYSPDSALGEIVAAALAARGAHAYTEVVFSALLATVSLALAREGRGLAWLPRDLAAAELGSGALVPAGGPEWSVEVEIRLYRPRARQSPAAEAFWAAVAG